MQSDVENQNEEEGSAGEDSDLGSEVEGSVDEEGSEVEGSDQDDADHDDGEAEAKVSNGGGST